MKKFFEKARKVAKQIDNGTYESEREMNNKPVAWMDKDTKSLYLDIPKKHYNDANMIPLYTALKELSDEEIWEIWEQFNGEIKNFAKAILKKASEK